MKLVFASDSFKGTISSGRAAELLEQAAHQYFPDAEGVKLELADGGEGTAEAIVKGRGGQMMDVMVSGPLGKPVGACYGAITADTAVFDMASASGLTLIDKQQRDLLQASSYGSGELLEAVLHAGYKNIYIGIGGSATNDGGLGFIRALGGRFIDESGNELAGQGRDLEKISLIDIHDLDPLVDQADITVLCDVTNPLTGADGATWTYGPQKGGSYEVLARLEAGMDNYRKVIIRQFGLDLNEVPGAGAAGGLGGALAAFTRARMRRGIETVLDILNFDEQIRNADLIITGEGRLDHTSVNGKAVQGVCRRAKAQGIPVIALVGDAKGGYESLLENGLNRLETTIDREKGLAYSLEHAEELYYRKACEIFSSL